MKLYDFNKVRELIQKNPDITSAELGMYEDWFWTAQTIFEAGKYTLDLVEGTEIAGIRGSDWATPTLKLIWPDGSERSIEVSQQISPQVPKSAHFELGVLSGPCQNAQPELETENIDADKTDC